MNFKRHLEIAWHLMLTFIAPLLIMTLVMFGVSFITIGILAPVIMAGYMQSVLLMIRDRREPKIQDLFSQMRLFLPLFLFGILVLIVSLVGFLLFVVPGFLLTFAISYCCIYLLPLMADRDMGLTDALRTSFHLALKDSATDHLVVMILYLGILTIGGSTVIGSLFTLPFATIFLMSVYDERISRGDLLAVNLK